MDSANRGVMGDSRFVVASNESDLTIKKESVVKLVGLTKAPYLNGRVGFVLGEKSSNGRFPVQLEGSYKSPTSGLETQAQLSFKETNLSLVSRTQRCNGCCTTFASKELDKCAACRLVKYCSKECQRADWERQHKLDCPILQATYKSMKNNNNDDEDKLPEKIGDRVFALTTRGGRYMQLKDYAAAERDFRRIIEKEHSVDAIGPYVNLASCLMIQGRLEEAIPYAEKAVTCKVVEGRNELQSAYCTLGSVHGMSGNYAVAERALKKGLELFPGDTELTQLIERMQKMQQK